MTRDELQQLVNQHGGLVSDPVPTTPTVKDQDPTHVGPGGTFGLDIPNPNPTYRYILKDGTQFDARATEQGGDNFQITDPGNAVKPPTAGAAKPAPFGQWSAVTDPNSGRRGWQDPSTGAITWSPEADANKPTLINRGDEGVFAWDGDPSHKPTLLLAGGTKPDKAQIVPFGNSLYSWDGATLTVVQTKDDTAAPSTYRDPNTNQVYQWDPGTKVWVKAPGIEAGPKPTTISTNTEAPSFVQLDAQGNVVGTVPNPNYQQPRPTQLTPDTVSPSIPLLKPDGSIQWVPNQNRVTAGEAMQDLMASVGLRVNGNQLSMDDAKSMLTGAINVMNAQTARQNAVAAQQGVQRAAASDILTAQQQAATTGAGLLNQRVQAGTQMLNSVLGMAGQGQRSGNMGGGLMSVPAGLGEQLVGGIQGFATSLGGGQGVYDTAASLVQKLMPDAANNPLASQAYAVLGQMLDKHQELTGEPHPLATSLASTPPIQTPTLGAQPAAQPQQPSWNLATGPQAPGTLLPPGAAGRVDTSNPDYLRQGWQTPKAQTAPVTINIGV